MALLRKELKANAARVLEAMALAAAAEQEARDLERSLRMEAASLRTQLAVAHEDLAAAVGLAQEVVLSDEVRATGRTLHTTTMPTSVSHLSTCCPRLDSKPAQRQYVDARLTTERQAHRQEMAALEAQLITVQKTMQDRSVPLHGSESKQRSRTHTHTHTHIGAVSSRHGRKTTNSCARSTRSVKASRTTQEPRPRRVGGGEGDLPKTIVVDVNAFL